VRVEGACFAFGVFGCLSEGWCSYEGYEGPNAK
jgi:hypothetical protein